MSNCRRYFRNHSRRMISGVLLLWIVLLQFPLPFEVMTVDASGKDLTVPFPCMYRACGCRSAEECWTSCCCTTRAERIAFVRKMGLEMPASLSGDEPEDVAAVCSSSGNCCSKPVTAASSECKQGAASACCAVNNSDSNEVADEASDEKQTRRVLLSAYLKCQGLSVQIALFSAVMLPVGEVLARPDVEQGERLKLHDDLWAGVLLSPPLPPPRLCVG